MSKKESEKVFEYNSQFVVFCVRQIKYSLCVQTGHVRQGHSCDFYPLESLECDWRSKIERERGTKGMRGCKGKGNGFSSQEKVMEPLRI